MALNFVAYRENDNNGQGSGFQRRTGTVKPKVNYQFKPPSWMTPQQAAEVQELIDIVHGAGGEHEGYQPGPIQGDSSQIFNPPGSEELGKHQGAPYSDRVRVGDMVETKGPKNWEMLRDLMRGRQHNYGDTSGIPNDVLPYDEWINGFAMALPMPPEYALIPRNFWADLELLSWFTPGGLVRGAAQRLGRSLIAQVASDLRKEIARTKPKALAPGAVSTIPAFAGWVNFGTCAAAGSGGLFWGIPSIVPNVFNPCDFVGDWGVVTGVQPTSWAPGDTGVVNLYQVGANALVFTTWLKAADMPFTTVPTITYGEANVIPKSITNKSYGDAIPNAQSTTWPSPPRAGTKEVKLRVRMRAVFMAINRMTEVFDFIEALWKALPRKYQTKVKGDRLRNPQFAPGYTRGQRAKPTPGQMFNDLYNHFDKIDWPEAVTQLIVNEIQDRIYGAAGKLGGKAGKLSGKGHSLQITRMGG